jgi:hypothetical protein
MRARFLPFSGLLLLATLAMPGLVHGYGVEENAGLRHAEWVGPGTVRIVVGPGFGDHQLSEKAFVFQVVSATDPRFQRGVAAAQVAVVATEPDGDYPAGWQGPRFERYTLELTLPPEPAPDPAQRYWLRINSAWIMAKNRQAAWIEPSGTAADPVAMAPRYGLREGYLLSPTALHVMTGAGIDLRRLLEPGNVTVSSPDDPAFAEPVAPARIGRRSNLDFYAPRGWPWRFHQRHELFLLLPRATSPGKTYMVNLNTVPGKPVTCGQATLTLANDDRATLNLALKVNQVGYLPDAEKYGYLGMWMGDAGACDFAAAATAFEVRDAATHAVVHQGTPTLRHRAGSKTETVYRQDLSHEDTWQLDLTPLRAPGEYYVAIPGMGRSFAFRVGDDIYAEPVRIAMNGVFHQRCGIELKAPHATPGVYRPACHRHNTEYGTMSSDMLHAKELVNFATDGVKHDLHGGHHDAGDWNPRSRLDYAEYLLLLYELNPKAFRDRQFSIPEAGNGLPDVLDEAWWSLDLWNRLQAKDGGVHAKVETAGDPLEGDTPENDRLREFAFRQEPGASWRYAANATWASLIWRDLGRRKTADVLLRRAVRAWDWAEANLAKFADFKGGANGRCIDQATFAAAMLLRATGEARFDEAFRRHSVIAADPAKPVHEYEKHDQTFGSFFYARLPEGVGDPELKRALVVSFEREFDQWRQAAETTNYRYMRSPYSPNTWGTGGVPAWLMRPAMTMALTPDPDRRAAARQWILFTNDFSLGCHPMNLVFTVGLGQRHVTGPWHILQASTPAGLIPGLHTNGPGGRGTPGAKPASGGMGSWPPMSLYPTGEGSWPDLYRYAENVSPGQNEGCWPQRMAFAYGLFLPPATETAPKQ